MRAQRVERGIERQPQRVGRNKRKRIAPLAHSRRIALRTLRMRIACKYYTKIVGRHLDSLREFEASLIRDLDDLFEIPQTPGRVGGSQLSVECLIACGGMAAKP